MGALYLLLIGSSLLLISIMLTPLSARVGMPVLLLFLGVGMLAGEDGPGGIQFSDFDTAFLIANLALAVILLDGGMRTRVETFRVGLRPAATLATLGVLLTAGITGVAAMWLLDLPLVLGLLMGAIVASTDAAAVFSLLQGRDLHLNERVSATLEIESGSNDPMAIFLTVLLLDLIVKNEVGLSASFLWLLLQQFGIGALAGVIGGYLLAMLVKRLDLALGLYSLLVVSAGLTLFSLTGLLGGSGFLAIYIVGLWLGNAGLSLMPNILQVHDGLAWLAQLGLFLVLGLLVSPSQMLAVALPALVLALILMLVARPLAVMLCLLPFRMNWRETSFISWVGLRGAVPIVLALFPVIAGIPEAELLFSVTCIVVLVSLLVQGTTLAPLARWLNLEVPAPSLPQRRIPLSFPDNSDHEIFLLPMRDIHANGMRRDALRLPGGSALVALFRNHGLMLPNEIDTLEPGDWLVVAGHSAAVTEIGKLLKAQEPAPRLAPRSFFGNFNLSGDVLLGELAEVYGVEIEPRLRELSLSKVITRNHRGHPVVGDRVDLGPLQLVVIAVDGDRVTRVGLKIPE